MKIQIAGGKINEFLGFESPLQKAKFFLAFFLFIFKFFTQNWVKTVFYYNLKLNKKRIRKNWLSVVWIRISSFSVHDLNFMEGEGDDIKSKQASKRDI